VRHRLAETLADVLLRRTMVAYGPKVALDLDLAAKVAQTHLGWSGERTGREYNPRDLRGMQPQEF
jgi:glycerol-3-phosphate dehydrogenase